MKNILALFILTFMASTTFAQNGFYLEPAIIAKVNSDSSIDYPSPLSNSSGSTDGMGAALKLGAHVMETLFVGADLRYEKLKFKDSTNNFDADGDGHNYGVILGLQTPVAGLRVWGNYIFGGEFNPAASNGFDAKFKEATGYRAGVGLHFLAVSINLEYEDLRYDKTEAEQIGPFSTSAEFDRIELNSQSYIVSLSFPFEF